MTIHDSAPWHRELCTILHPQSTGSSKYIEHYFEEFRDRAAARKTLHDKRAFIETNPVVHCSTIQSIAGIKVKQHSKVQSSTRASGEAFHVWCLVSRVHPCRHTFMNARPAHKHEWARQLVQGT